MQKTIINGGVTRQYQYGTFDYKTGIPPLTEGCAFSLAGWGCKPDLQHAGIGAKGTSIPQLWLCEESPTFAPVYQRLVVTGTKPEVITRNGATAGVLYEDAYAQYCLLTGILPADLSASRADQTTSVFEEIEQILSTVGMTFDHVARTWLYMDKILEWYDPFNRARDAFFQSRDIYNKLVPASTGIGSANLFGAAIAANAIAVKPKGRSVSVQMVDSPLQCSALHYRSSFSRAVEIATPDYRSLLISGTASIEQGGATAYVDDVEKQIDLTMDVVEAILVSREMTWADTTRAVMYLKHPEYLPVWNRYLQKRGLHNMPLVNVHADVCRDDLLVELELDAVKKA